jgi:nucleotide-binding universal stress UspA family protein
MPKQVRTIVAGVATVHDTDPILAPAIAMAEATGAELHFVHAFELPDPILSAYARDGLLGPQFGARYRDELRTRLEERVAMLDSSAKITCHAVTGGASEAICGRAEKLEADVLLIGATRSGKLLRSILGSTAERVVRGATVPVIVLRNPLAIPMRRVLLTTDLSEFSASVHERGIDLIEGMFPAAEPEIRSLLVIWYDVSFPPPLKRDSLESVAREELREFLAARRQRRSSVHSRVRIGDPAKEITAESIDWQADLLVLGTHSRSGRSRFLLGSVAEATVRTTQANVLILPPTPAGAGRNEDDPRPAAVSA